jgi:hypothetical protein
MIKSIAYTITAILLSIAFFIGVDIYLKTQFDDFYGALDVLYKKVEDETATREDGYAVRSMWADKKTKLHVFIPHNDISYVDYWLNEACALIYNGEYVFALGKIEVLKEIAKNLPAGYTVRFENIF